MFLILITKFVYDQPKVNQNSQAGQFWPGIWLAITNKNNWFAGIYSGMITIPETGSVRLYLKTHLPLRSNSSTILGYPFQY